MIWLVITTAALTGYAIGHYRPGHRMSDWAAWQSAGKQPARHSIRWWAVFTVLSVDTACWLITHPAQGWNAWKHRNDPPPPRSPAPTFDPDWVEKRRATANDQET